MRYRDRQGNLKPVRFVSYLWKRIDGHILDGVKRELEREKELRAELVISGESSNKKGEGSDAYRSRPFLRMPIEPVPKEQECARTKRQEHDRNTGCDSKTGSDWS